MHDEEDDHHPPEPTAAMAAAKELRTKQLETFNRFVKGEPVDFKNHQGTSFPTKFNPADFAKPKTQRLKFVDKYKFFDSVLNSEDEEGSLPTTDILLICSFGYDQCRNGPKRTKRRWHYCSPPGE
jgi:hypothetical protein